MRPRTWISTLLLVALTASPALAQEDEELACLDLLWEQSFEGFVPDERLDGFVGCLEFVEGAVAETKDPPDPKGPNICLDGFWNLVAQDPIPDPDPNFLVAQDPIPDPDPDFLVAQDPVPAPEPDFLVACVAVLEEALAGDPMPELEPEGGRLPEEPAPEGLDSPRTQTPAE